jgi:DNA-binding MarR family transcriptional regulator
LKNQDSTDTPAFPPEYLREAYRIRFSRAAADRLETVFAIKSATLQITNVLHEWLDGTVGTPARFQTLALLWGAGDRLVPHQEIISALQVKRATVSALMFSLEQEGLVRSIGDQKDRRRLLATLTEEGKNVVERAMDVNASRVERALSDLSPEEQLVLQKLLGRAKDGFQKAAAYKTDS